MGKSLFDSRGGWFITQSPIFRREWAIVFIICFLLILPGAASAQQTFGSAQQSAIRESVYGDWIAEVGGGTIRITFADTGLCTIDGEDRPFLLENGSIVLTAEEGRIITYQMSFPRKDALTLSGGDLAQPIAFTRAPAATRIPFNFNIRLSVYDIRAKAITIAIVILIVAFSRLLLFTLNIVSQALINSDRGIMRYLYRRNKKRTRTVHSLTLDVLKYIVYFAAIGRILSEFGVNYTAYFASLSVIGLAVGFGSQGLVQDVVTGFFLMFEGQFDVGDMVEISGQVGQIREMGLRMTRIRNYQGQLVFIPNRNIAVAGRYICGGLEGYVDIALENDEAVSVAAAVTMRLLDELGKQFDGVFLEKPKEPSPLSLETGEIFLRVSILIWPGQAWIVDQQLIPRLRERFGRENIVIPADRIVSFYHVRKSVPVDGLGERFRSIGKRILRRERKPR